jgi:hypothetical protein
MMKPDRKSNCVRSCRPVAGMQLALPVSWRSGYPWQGSALEASFILSHAYSLIRQFARGGGGVWLEFFLQGEKSDLLQLPIPRHVNPAMDIFVFQKLALLLAAKMPPSRRNFCSCSLSPWALEGQLV